MLNHMTITSHQIQFMNMVRSMNISSSNVMKTVRTGQEVEFQQDAPDFTSEACSTLKTLGKTK